MYSQLELKYTKLEFHGQKQEMIEQNKTLKIQRFENTFFQMISLYNSIVESLNYNGERGRYYFKKLFENFSLNVDSEKTRRRISGKSTELMLNDYLNLYGNLYENNKPSLFHYFTTLYQIVRFIDESEVDNKKRYIAIIRSQVSPQESVMLFYNCLYRKGGKFKTLIEKYSLFNNIDNAYIFNEEHKKEYQERAFA